MTLDYTHQVVSAIKAAANQALPDPIERHHSLVLHLGFDSMKMALLSLALEGQLACPIVLDGWIASHRDPNDLTVGSLCDYLRDTITSHEQSGIQL